MNMRKEQTVQFNQEITRKSKQILSQDKIYDLNTCIKIALENNLEVKIVEIDSRLAKLDKKIAFSYFLPQVDVQATR
ncbi:MAG: TolC family protein, partial [Desulfobacteraceae bacterium]